jgi:adhesin/invasin
VTAVVRSTITVTVRDQFANPIGGATVSLSANGTNNTIGQPVSTTNSSGQTTGTLSSFTAQSKTVTALVNGSVTITQTATVVVNPDIVNAGTSTVSRATATIAACSLSCVAGTTASTITVTARDQFSNTVPTVPVTIASSGANNTFVPASGSTNGSGVFTTNFNSTLAQAKTITATVNGVVITQTAAVTVVAAAPTSIAVNGGNNQQARVGTAVATAPSAIVRDAFSNPVVGLTVTFTASSGGGSVTGGSPVTNASGIATVGSWTLQAGNADNASGLMPNTLNAAAAGAGSVNFSGNAFYTWSGDVASLFNASSPYACHTCHTVVFNRNPNNIVGVGATTGTACTAQTRVIAGNAFASLLYLKVDSNTVNQCGSKMPFTASFFSAAELKRLRAWINAGALDN